ncbi:MAG: hypothetical protein HEP71_01685 [Roseivirga sp.]|nr:hypothetical protein [Roseivirga sp.]
MKPKHRIVLLIYLSFWSLNLNGQQELNNDKIEPVSFIRHIGNAGISRGVTIEQIKGGGYILTGYTTDGEHGGEDVFLIKTNSKGEPIWKKTFGGQGKDNGWAVRQTDDGGFIVVGYTDSFGNGGMDVYLIKTDFEGDTIWTKTYGGDGDEFGWDVRITEDNGFIIAAQTNSQGNGEVDAYLIKVDKKGDEEWSNTYGGDKTDRVFSVQQTPDGGYVAVGITYSYTSINQEDRDGYLLKTDPAGKQVWYKTFGNEAYDVAHSVTLNDDNGFLITGYGESFAKNGNRDLYLIKTDGFGESEWIKTYGGVEEERGIKGQQTKDEGFVAIGFTSENRDVYLIKTNSAGDTLWTRTYGEKDKVDFGYTVKETYDGGYVLVGHTASFSGDEGSILLIKTDSEGLVKQRE